MSLTDAIQIPIQCPKCGHTIKKRLSELQRNHAHTLTCVCGVRFQIDPAGFNAAGKSLDDLQKALSKLGK